jgi:hypothetical protein
MWQILLTKLTKNVLKEVNFTNLKTSSGYITKLKPQEVSLQITQTLGGDYAI